MESPQESKFGHGICPPHMEYLADRRYDQAITVDRLPVVLSLRNLLAGNPEVLVES